MKELIRDLFKEILPYLPGVLIGVCVILWFINRKFPVHKKETETWCAAIKEFDVEQKKEIVYYNIVVIKNNKIHSIQNINGETIFPKDFVSINDAPQPWDVDIVLKSGMHMQIERLRQDSCKSNQIMDKIKRDHEDYDPNIDD